MTEAHSIVLFIAASLLALGLLLVPGRSRRLRAMRALVHLVSLLAFGIAGWTLAQGEYAALRIPALVFGFVLTGFFWIVSIRLRFLRRREEPADGILEPSAEGTGAEETAEPLGSQGRSILSRLVEMRRQTIASLGTPREKIVYAERDGGIDAALASMRRRRFLRIPMVDGSLDRIVGVLHAKDVIPASLSGASDQPLKMILRRPLFVSSDRTIANLLELFRSQRGHLAIVVDEYNRTVGLVSRDDVFRFLSGEGDR
ncbi:MAG: CBS domain-containing protein [Candidatus Eisenbacteria bacterium]|nr:CBS domain-containing protein [Candidatus Latescibacterota bacterium]MBD3301728.1 CBS domain-containing protein [Candidatus Eisenbacteria bacterium]